MKISASHSAIFNRRILLAVALCFLGLGLAMFSFATMDEGPYQRPGSTERVSEGTGGTEGDRDSSFPSMSADGRVVAFHSQASNLVPDDTNGKPDVFVHDHGSGITQRVSVGPGGVQGNNESTFPSISADGRYVSFYSSAPNLVPEDLNAAVDVFLYDRETGSTERVSVSSGGVQGNADCISSPSPTLSADGRYVVFVSGASNLISGDTNGVPDVFVRDRQTGVTERVSVGGGGVEGNDRSILPAINADGRYVAFSSRATNLVAGDTNAPYEDVFVRDRVAGTTERISVSSHEAEGTGPPPSYGLSNVPFMSADGRYVAFVSYADNLVPADANESTDVFVRDRVAGTTERISVSGTGAEGCCSSIFPSMSADGRFVAFHGGSNNLVPGDNNNTQDVFVHDRETGATERVSVGYGGAQGEAFSIYPQVSADARYVAFQSIAPNLVPDDTNDCGVAGFEFSCSDVFVRDRGSALGVGALAATCAEGTASVSGWATFSGAAIASADDDADDGATGAAEAGAELTGASLAYRPEGGDLMVRLLVASLIPTVPGAPVLYGFELTVGTARYEVRVQADAAGAAPFFGLYRCDPSCVELASLAGGFGTTGEEIVVAVPLTALGASEGVSLTNLRAYTAFGDAATGPGVPLDDVAVPVTILPVHSVSLGIAPAGTPEAQVAFDTPATLAAGTFSGTLAVPGPGDYDVWARPCLGATCGPAVSSPLTACLPVPTPTSAVSRKTHDTAGNFDVDLPIAGNPGIECRTGGTNNDYQMLVTFANAVTFNSAAVTSGTGSVASTSGSGTPAVMVNLTGVANAQTITVTLIGVNDGNNTGDVAVRMGVLLGDTTANGAVNSSDIAQTKSKSGQVVTSTNFRQDVTINGSINSSDISLVKSKSGTALP